MMTARVAWLHVGLSLLVVFGLAAALAISSAAAAYRVVAARAQLRGDA